jgi:hypothetical protein
MNRLPDTRSTAHRLTDEELDYYGEIFLRSGLREAGLDFETFLSDPEQYLRRCAARPDAEKNGRRSRRLLKFLRLRPAPRSSNG